MPRGLSRCRYCGKLVPSLYKRHHEKRTCREMRQRRGEKLPPERKPRERLTPEEPRPCLDPWLRPSDEDEQP